MLFLKLFILNPLSPFPRPPHWKEKIDFCSGLSSFVGTSSASLIEPKEKKKRKKGKTNHAYLTFKKHFLTKLKLATSITRLFEWLFPEKFSFCSRCKSWNTCTWKRKQAILFSERIDHSLSFSLDDGLLSYFDGTGDTHTNNITLIEGFTASLWRRGRI